MPSRLNLMGLTTLDGRPTRLAKAVLALALVVAFGAGFVLRPDPGAEPAAATAAVRSEVVLEGGAEPRGAAPRLAGAAALPALDRTPRRKDTGATAPVPAATASPAPEEPSAPAGEPEAAPVSTPAPAAPAPPAAAPAPAAPRPAPAPARPAPAPTGQSFDSSG